MRRAYLGNTWKNLSYLFFADSSESISLWFHKYMSTSLTLNLVILHHLWCWRMRFNDYKQVLPVTTAIFVPNVCTQHVKGLLYSWQYQYLHSVICRQRSSVVHSFFNSRRQANCCIQKLKTSYIMSAVAVTPRDTSWTSHCNKMQLCNQILAVHA